MGSFSMWHWLVVLVVVILVFGTKKLSNVGKDLGSAIKGFKEGMKDSAAPTENTSVTPTPVPPAKVVDIQATPMGEANKEPGKNT